MGRVKLTRTWGVAENGDVVEIALAPALMAQMASQWPPLGLERRDRPAEPLMARFGLSDTSLIEPNRETSGANPSSKAWGDLDSQLSLFTVNRLTRLVPVHAAAIAWNGSVLMVPGQSMAGKSTLALAAHDFGARVLSDEYTLIDPATGLVVGWNRPIRKRVNDGSTALVDVAVASDPLPVRLVALLRYEDQTSSWNELSAADAAIEILSHTFSARTRPNESFDAVVAVSRGAQTIRGTRSSAHDVIPDLLALMDP